MGRGLSEPAPTSPSAWRPNRLEHSFAVQADLPGGRVVLASEEYRGGRLDWHDFTAAGQPSLGAPATPVAPTSLVRTTLPAPVSYGGMPADRFWEIEDATVRFGGLDTGRTELARMLLAEFALTFGNDWFVVPVDLPVGSVTSIDSFTVTDSFGIPTQVSRSAPPEGGFRMFETDAPAGPQRVQGLFLLAPTTAEVAESPPTEHVVFFRDELANVVWGVERTVPGRRRHPRRPVRGAPAAARGAAADRHRDRRRPAALPAADRRARPLAPVRARPGRRDRPDAGSHPAGAATAWSGCCPTGPASRPSPGVACSPPGAAAARGGGGAARRHRGGRDVPAHPLARRPLPPVVGAAPHHRRR